MGNPLPKLLLEMSLLITSILKLTNCLRKWGGPCIKPMGIENSVVKYVEKVY